MNSDEGRRKNRTLEEALNFFKSLTPDVKLRGSVELHLSLVKVVGHATTYGLNPGQIEELSDVILSSNNKLSQADRSKLVKCLIPSSVVPQNAAVKAIIAISSRVFANPGPQSLHSLLIRWLLLVYDRLDRFDVLHKLYNVIFTFVQSALLLPHACHLLFMLTRKHDVKLYKVQQLVALTKQFGPEPSIMGLLLIYKMYCPHLVSWKLNYSRKVFFKAHDKAWRLNILDVASRNEEDSGNPLVQEEIQSRKEKELQPKSKRHKGVVPDVHFEAGEIQEDTDQGSDNEKTLIPYTQIDTFTNFLDKLDQIEYPSQIAAVLNCERLQLLLSCDSDPIVTVRLSLWLQHVLSFGFRVRNKLESETFDRLLRLLLHFSAKVTSLPLVEGFLISFLSHWDGRCHAPVIMALLATIDPASYQDLYGILKPLYRLFFSSDIYFKVQCLNSFVKILGGQIRKMNINQDQQTNEEAGKIVEVVRGLVRFLDGLCVMGLRTEDDHHLMQIAASDFVQVSCEMYQRASVPMNDVRFPIETIHRLLLSDCPVILARVCQAINELREYYKNLSYPERDGDTRDKFNGLLQDTMGMLWTGKLSYDTGKNKKLPSMFDSLPPTIKVTIPEDSFTMFCGKAFLGLARSFLKETQPEGKKVHPRQIKTFKPQYLMFLEREGFPEFKKLVDSSMRKRKKDDTK